MSLTLLVITDGRPGYLQRAVQSFDEAVDPAQVTARLLVDDSLDPAHAGWARRELHFDHHIDGGGAKLGFAGAIQAGWSALPPSTEFVFHLEDDFVLERPVDVAAIMRLLRRRPYLQQVALRRQAWNQLEREAGGVVESHSDSYLDMHEADASWLEHRLFFTTNPSLYHARLTRWGWPQRAGSERAFTELLLRDDDARFAYWGERGDGPWCEHIGHHRAGTGY